MQKVSVIQSKLSYTMNYTMHMLENTCPILCGGESLSGGAMVALFISSGLLGLILFAVLSLLAFTCHQATMVEQKRDEYISLLQAVDEDIVEDIKSHLDEAYCTIPDEYLDQKIGFMQLIQRSSIHSNTSFSSSKERSDSMEAIDTMLGMMVNPDACQQQRRHSSMDLQDALSVFRGESRSSSIHHNGEELIENQSETSSSKIKDIRRSSSYNALSDEIMILPTLYYFRHVELKT